MAQPATLSTTTTAPQPKIWGGGRSPFNVSYGKMMMWFFLITDTFTFGAFLIALGTTRFFSAVWPDPNFVFNSAPFLGGGYPLVFVSIMTFILIMSSVTMVLAVHAGHYKDRKAVIKWLLWTIIGGITFLSCQVWEWVHLYQEGAWWGTFTDPNMPKETYEHFFRTTLPSYANTAPAYIVQSTHNFFNYFFTITGFHGFHVSIGVGLLIMTLINVINGTYERRGHYEMVEKIGLYWHFVDLVWVFVFTIFYLL